MCQQDLILIIFACCNLLGEIVIGSGYTTATLKSCLIWAEFPS